MARSLIRPLLVCGALFAFSACSEEATDETAATTDTAPAATVTEVVETESSLPPPEAIVISVDGLKNRYFVLEQFNGDKISFETRQPELMFDADMRMTGGMCNRFMGPGSLEGDTLTARLAATLMLCADQTQNDLERAFFNMMENGAKLSSVDGNLVITSADGANVLVFAPADPPADSPIGGTVRPLDPATPAE